MATLEYLWQLTKAPLELEDAHVEAALRAGASPGALEQASVMAQVFAYMNRMVDAFGADATPEEGERIAKILDTVGGGIESFSRKRVQPWPRFAGVMPTLHTEQLHIIRTGEGDSPAHLRTAIEARVAAASGGRREAPAPLPPAVEALVDTLAVDAHGVTDEHIDDLRPDWSEAAIFEFVFVASFAAGLGRMERSIELLADR